jgi:hypothetical protein
MTGRLCAIQQIGNLRYGVSDKIFPMGKSEPIDAPSDYGASALAGLFRPAQKLLLCV